MEEKSVSKILEISIQIILGILFLFFPFFYLTINTDYFNIPKMALVTSLSLLGLIILGFKEIFNKKLSFRHTPLDIPYFLFILILIISAFTAIDRFDSLIYTLPFLFLGVFYFVFINSVKTKQEIHFFVLTFIFASILLSLFQLLTFFKIYPLPFISSHNPLFTPTGSLIDTSIFILSGFLIILSLITNSFLRKKDIVRFSVFGFCLIVTGIASFFTIYKLFTNSQPLILPLLPSFQIAFSAISQDSGRILQGFLLGSGFGTFSTDFTRFKPTYFNGYTNFWYVDFSKPFSFIFDVLTTSGILGLLAFIFLIFKTLKNYKTKLTNPFFISLIFIILATFMVPFSYFTITLLLIEFTFFSTYEAFKDPRETEFSLLTIKKIFKQNTSRVKTNFLIPLLFFILIIIFSTASVYYTAIYILSDSYFQTAISAANSNNGNLAYQTEVKAINIFPYRDIYYQLFSQTNILIANSLASLQKNQIKTQATKTQTTIINLIQQAISASKTAVGISPLKVSNWQNLASVYKSIIGVGKNADTFAIQSIKQAILIDPNNPQEYITLGGIYYQIGDYNNAIFAFQSAISLKPDFANAYYNLGHAFEQKKDLTDALIALKNVKTLVKSDPINLKKINTEILDLEAQIKNNQPANAQQTKFSKVQAPIQPLISPTQNPTNSTPSSK